MKESHMSDNATAVAESLTANVQSSELDAASLREDFLEVYKLVNNESKAITKAMVRDPLFQCAHGVDETDPAVILENHTKPYLEFLEAAARLGNKLRQYPPNINITLPDLGECNANRILRSLVGGMEGRDGKAMKAYARRTLQIHGR
jgi:hypothetical protein